MDDKDGDLIPDSPANRAVKAVLQYFASRPEHHAIGINELGGVFSLEEMEARIVNELGFGRADLNAAVLNLSRQKILKLTIEKPKIEIMRGPNFNTEASIKRFFPRDGMLGEETNFFNLLGTSDQKRWERN